MAVSVPLDEKIRIAGDLSIRARIFFDIWWFYESADTRRKVSGTMNEYSEFFRFDSHAHFAAFVVHVAMLFEKRHDTVNLSSLVREAEASRSFPAVTVAQAEQLLSHARPLVEKVAILRSNLFAHRSNSLSYADAFRKASVSADELRDLTDRSLTIVNLLLGARGEQERCFHRAARDDAEKLLNDLASSA